MSRQEQIVAIKAALAALNSAIAQTEAALRTAANPDDVRSLNARLVDLRSERSRLQDQLDNLEAAGVKVQAPGFAIAPMKNALDKSLEDRSVVRATLAFGKAVHGHAKKLRRAIGGEAPAPRAKRR
jgi:predicted  nucleic acid-binding Zn-ribbon protein